MGKDDSVLRIELKNSKPVELADLTVSFAAIAESFRDYANDKVEDPVPDSLRLYVQEMRSGSVIADLVALADQAQWIIKHADVFAGFITNTTEIANYFLGKPKNGQMEPTARQARQIAHIVEPVAKDFGSQFNINVLDGGMVNIHQHFHITPIEANAIQNGVSKYLGPSIPSSQLLSGQLMTLEQVKNNLASKSGDRGIIEAISDRAVKLQFTNEEAKRKVLDLEENPLHCVFQVTVEVQSTGGKPALYRIIEVTEIIHQDA